MKIIATFIFILSGFLFNFNNGGVDEKKVDAAILDRETVEVIDYAKGIVRQVGNTDTYMIECTEKHIKLNVINLPAEYKEADLPVVFSGNIKLTAPLEDEDGEFFEVKTIH